MLQQEVEVKQEKSSPKKEKKVQTPPKKRTAQKQEITPNRRVRRGLFEQKDEVLLLFKNFIKLDKEIEMAKQDLALRPDFNLFDTFRMFDKLEKGSITSAELQETLNELQIYPTKEELYLFVRRFDKDSDGKIRFSDFVEAMSPKQAEYKSLLNSRNPVNEDQSFTIN